MNTYKDTLPGQSQPYLYLSSYDGQGYDVTNELPASPPLEPTFTDVYRQGPNGSTTSSPFAALEPQLLSDYFARLRPALTGTGGEYESGRSQGPVGRNALGRAR